MNAIHVVCVALFCQIVALLNSTTAANCRYRVQATTGIGYNAGTKARVFIQLYGSAGKCPERELESPNGFMPKTTMEFVITCPCIGQQRSLIIRHDNSGAFPAWRLSSVTVQRWPNYSRHIYLVFDWLMKGSGKSLSTWLRQSYCTYQVRTVTGRQRSAATHANVYIQLSGSVATSKWIRLYHPGKQFSRGKTDYFTVYSRCVGYQRRVTIRRDNAGTNPMWYLKTISVKSVSPPGPDAIASAYSVYRVNTWISNSRQFQKPSTNYVITVYTGSQSTAGTEAKVMIALWRGHEQSAGCFVLDHKGGQEFEQGGVDTFHATGYDVGYVSRIHVKHNKAGRDPAWFIQKIYVLSLSTNEMFECPCYKWLRKSNPGEYFNCFQTA